VNSDTVLVVVIVASLATALLAYEAYLQQQNSLANQIGKGLGAGLGGLLGGLL